MTDNKITPIRLADFGLAEHRFRRFDAVVPVGLAEKDLEDPMLWSHVAPKMNAGDQIRATAYDFSFVADLIVTFSQGTDARVKVRAFDKLDKVDLSTLNDLSNDYAVETRGPKGWCVVKKSTNEIIEESLPSKGDAQKTLDQYVKILRS